jgi:hypothetical protein
MLAVALYDRSLGLGISTQAASNVHPLFPNTHDGFDPEQSRTMTLLL